VRRFVVAASFGVFFEHLPGRGYGTRATSVALVLLILILLLGAGIVTSAEQHYILVAFELFGTIGYASILARFYRRYTREVKLEAPDYPGTSVLVDNRNYTGKMRTFSVHSSHSVRATSEEKTFKEWLVSGGVSVEDPHSFETTMTVEGDGLLKAVFGK
jgi:hypothetical protein